MPQPDSVYQQAVPIAMIHPGALSPTVWKEFQDRWAGEFVLIELEKNSRYLIEALGGGDHCLTVEQIANDIEHEIRDHFNLSSRWILGGWSFGGVVANCLLGQFVDDELPAAMVLLDSIAAVPKYHWIIDNGRELSPSERSQVFSWFSMYLSAKQGVDLGLSASDFKGETQKEALAAVIKRARECAAPISDASIEGLGKVFDVFLSGLQRNNRLARAHSAPSCRVAATLIRPKHSLLPHDPHMGWDELSDSLTTLSVPGDHYSMVYHPDAVHQITKVLASIL